MTEQFNEQDELEYNDGLGDLLKERDQLQFSWGKTATVLVAILAVTFALFWGFFKTNSTSEKVEFTEIETTQPIEINVDNNSTENTVIETVNEKEESAVVEDNTTGKKVIQPKIETKPTLYRVYAGTFSEKQNAEELKSMLSTQGIDSFIWQKKQNDNLNYIVQVGSFKKKASAEKHAATINAKGFEANVVQK